MAKVAVVGCGAMGSVYAALMADAGHEVHAVHPGARTSDARNMMRFNVVKIKSPGNGRGYIRIACADRDED